MLISKKWLQSYFTNELPSMQKIADTLLLHSFEIEGLEEKNGDWVLDIDVLPNRAHDCLCHEGIAKEISGLLGLPLKKERFSSFSDIQNGDKNISIHIENKNQCSRYLGVLVKNIEVRESPEWLKNRLSAMGQKTINALVDATNFVLFDSGQPMHVFDADKIIGDIFIRNAKEGEKMTTLTGEDIELIPEDLVIADEEKILALAGVKGGNAAELTKETKNILIESANFNPLSTRKTARRVKILTDASKRYENGISSEKAEIAIQHMLSLVLELASTDETSIGEIVDVYPKIETPFSLSFTQAHTEQLLGFPLKNEEIADILHRFSYIFQEENGNYKVSIPSERLDLRIPEDMIEEIGRIYGYHNIPVKSLEDYVFKAEINRDFYTSQKLRNFFIELGFTEIMNYTFVKKGEVELFNPLASDKKSLRKNLFAQMKLSLEKNERFADMVNEEQLLLFEIDTIHTKKGEELVCCFGVDTLSKKSRKKYGDEHKQIETTLSKIEELFSIEKLDFIREGNTVQFSLHQLSRDVSEDGYGDMLTHSSYGDKILFQRISIYPYVKRDISFWIENSSADEIKESIEKLSTHFLKRVYLFDSFEKEGRTSYAFSLIFQSFEKTLTDEEVAKDMKIIEEYIISLGGEIR